jgi:hypothetical protein
MKLVEQNVLPEYFSIPGPAPDQRHAQPSGPWPWMDLEAIESHEDAPEVTAILPPDAPKWRGYPQSDFPNWTPVPVRRSRIRDMIDKRPESPCKIYCVDVLESGEFKTLDLRTICDTEASRKDFWTMMHKKRPPGIRVRSLCVENMSGAVLQMLGHK